MKKAPSLTIFLLWIAVQAQAQEQSTYLWPIDGAKAGTNIVSTPQSYIGGEQNFSNLFITAPEGTIVLSPSKASSSTTAFRIIPRYIPPLPGNARRVSTSPSPKSGKMQKNKDWTADTSMGESLSNVLTEIQSISMD